MNCFKCGECCKTFGDIKLSPEEYKDLYEIKPFNAEFDNGKYIIPKPCVFYENECSIYDHRPTMCRMHHCGRINEGDKRVEWMGEMRILMDTNPEYKEFITKMENDAVEYGNKHGWSLHK